MRAKSRGDFRVSEGSNKDPPNNLAADSVPFIVCFKSQHISFLLFIVFGFPFIVFGLLVLVAVVAVGLQRVVGAPVQEALRLSQVATGPNRQRDLPKNPVTPRHVIGGGTHPGYGCSGVRYAYNIFLAIMQVAYAGAQETCSMRVWQGIF